MKQSLQLRIGQSLSMTPQLQQAIKLLQLSSLELQNEIQEVLESNPLLEVKESSSLSESDNKLNNDLEEIKSVESTIDSLSENRATQELPEELATDSNWEDFYDQSPTAIASSTSSAPSDTDQRDIYENKSDSSHSLSDHLIWQLDNSRLSDTDYDIGLCIIDGLDDKGYLIEDILSIKNSLLNHINVDIEEIEAILHLIQNFDPIGIASRSASECVTIQLNHLSSKTPHLKTALTIAKDFLEQIAANDITTLKRRLNIPEKDIKEAILLIRSTNPFPGQSMIHSVTEYISPDVYVRKIGSQWVASINSENAPNLTINNLYAGYIKRGDNSPDNTFLKNHLQEAKWFIKSLQSRHDTLLKVANEIIKKQTDFLNYGEEAMKPMVLKDIADRIDMHESTISRITTNKFMHTPRGIFEFKYFFSSHINTSDGGACSSTAIRSIIKKMIQAELPKKPLSDNKIAKLLDGEGINVARRTVAKYREALNIPPSNERRRLF